MTHPDEAVPHPALLPLIPLLGDWRWLAARGGDEILGQGWARFEWLEGGAFLMGLSNSDLDDLPTVTIAGVDDASGQFTQLYSDGRGILRIYQMWIQGSKWEIRRDAPGFFQRFEGLFGEDGETITAHWDFSEDGTDWQRDFDVAYVRVR